MSREVMEQTLKHMRASYGNFLDRATLVELDPSKVPEGLVAYVPYAALWGITDDLEREQCVVRAPDEARKDLVRTVQLIDDQLDEWLGGDEANANSPSTEYIAFSAMRMAADFI